MVTGGVGIDSTEIFEEGQWKFADSLPRKEYGMQGLSLGNKVFMMGTLNEYHILSTVPMTQGWDL